MYRILIIVILMVGVQEINIDQLPKNSFSAMLVQIASKKIEKCSTWKGQAAILDLHATLNRIISRWESSWNEDSDTKSPGTWTPNYAEDPI